MPGRGRRLGYGGTDLEFRLPGAVQATVDGQVVELGGWQRRALLAILLLHANRTVPADRLIAMLWPAGPPRSAARNLQVRVSQVRRLLTDGRRLAFREPGYRLKVLDGELDLHRFERLVDHGRQELAAGRADRGSFSISACPTSGSASTVPAPA